LWVSNLTFFYFLKMGLSIHYSGRFNIETSLNDLIEEVKDFAEVNQWGYAILNTSFSEDLLGKENYTDEVYGIVFTPPKCETVSFTFLSNGRMCSVAGLRCFGNSEKEDSKRYLYMLSTKTQYAGIEIHKTIIHLFKYLAATYLLDFTLSDEGQYWETADEKILKKTFKTYTGLIESFKDSLDIFPPNKNESLSDYMLRMAEKIQKKLDSE
jgi:hypothetical protein